MDNRIALWKTLQELYEMFNPRDWIWLISYSGGKDSSLLLLLTLGFAEAKGFTVSVVYNDSGGDLPELRNLVFRVLDIVSKRGHQVYITRPEMTFFDYLLTRYSPPRWNFRWCCKRLKEIPFRRLAEQLLREKPVLNLLGLRREEARWRNWKLRVVNERLVYVAPLNHLNNNEVWELLEETCRRYESLGFVYEELKRIYNGSERSGCWYCPLVIDDTLLRSRPLLLRLKLEILEAWCTERRRIIELSKRYPDLVKITIPINNETIQPTYPCGRKCNSCAISHIRVLLREVLRSSEVLNQTPSIQLVQ